MVSDVLIHCFRNKVSDREPFPQAGPDAPGRNGDFHVGNDDRIRRRSGGKLSGPRLGTADDDKSYPSEQLFDPMPQREFGQEVIPDHQPGALDELTVSDEAIDRLKRVRYTGMTEFELTRSESIVAGDRAFNHRKPVLRRDSGGATLEGVLSGRYKQNDRCAGDAKRFLGGEEVSLVDRIE
jgi:hypothetical protein